ncbi:MAG: type I-A CRISPR-associated protein Cas7/Csa2 [Candidatus Odinarchaeum yellowstonii]|uniref:Type I-A CRISPR-associated protein Cas7/Csa2 n=1 Tax=Odinarchaeota yellowstonii (strain LCB_4) TaxID=1841599 RepID=A0AAF0IBE6_ODILC|nr:MAG: type I-A CRISPR-associated protein Cas7/Csa2 [Candidatus Odinarchaeum yellowstonii]
MKDLFISVRGRLLLNVEAMNMVESLGNYVKHRKVPVLVPQKEGFVTYFVPAISGETIAHGFQKIIAEEAVKNNLPVCKLCKAGVFLKSTNKNVFEEAFSNKSDDKNIEEVIVKNCTVEDIGGFLYAEKGNVKRTSNFYVGYMIPVKETLEHVVIDPQLHSRYALGTKFVSEEGQRIYYVEVSSSLYTFSLDLDTRYIGKLTFEYENAGKDVVTGEERIKRLDAVLDSLKIFLLENCFGAKKTRFLPTGDWDSIVIGVSDNTWTVSSPFTESYIDNSIKKKSKVDYNTELYIGRKIDNNIDETIITAVEKTKQRIRGK